MPALSDCERRTSRYYGTVQQGMVIQAGDNCRQSARACIVDFIDEAPEDMVMNSAT